MVYGNNIRLSSDTPDGQIINIQAQAKRDILEKILQVYNSLDPDLAIGTALDRIAAFNNIQRKAESKTRIGISIASDGTLTLEGQESDNPFTIRDSTNQNEFELVEGFSFNGASSRFFEAKEFGPIPAIPSSSDIEIVTPNRNIRLINLSHNLLFPTTIGSNEESDFDFRQRRRDSILVNALGFSDSLRAELLNIEGINFARVYENTTSVTDASGIPPHSIWVIVNRPSAGITSIAEAIYSKRVPGIGMKGDQSINLPEVDGQTFTARFDYTQDEDVFIEIDGVRNDMSVERKTDDITEALDDQLKAPIGGSINSNEITCITTPADSNYVVSNSNFSKMRRQTVSFSTFPSKDEIPVASGRDVLIGFALRSPSNITNSLTRRAVCAASYEGIDRLSSFISELNNDLRDGFENVVIEEGEENQIVFDFSDLPLDRLGVLAFDGVSVFSSIKDSFGIKIEQEKNSIIQASSFRNEFNFDKRLISLNIEAFPNSYTVEGGEILNFNVSGGFTTSLMVIIMIFMR